MNEDLNGIISQRCEIECEEKAPEKWLQQLTDLKFIIPCFVFADAFIKYD